MQKFDVKWMIYTNDCKNNHNKFMFPQQNVRPIFRQIPDFLYKY